MEILIMGAIYGGAGLLMWLGIHYGSKWIDKMLLVPPPLDPNKPIVLPHLQDRQFK